MAKLSKKMHPTVVVIRDLAASIYDHAGSFLIRTFCDTLAAALREAADVIDRLDGELSQASWKITQLENEVHLADQVNGQANAYIEQLEQILLDAGMDIPGESRGPSESSEGSTGGQGFS